MLLKISIARGVISPNVVPAKARSALRFSEAGDFPSRSPGSRRAELEKDYLAMQPMFLNEPPPFGSVLETLADLERRMNH